VKISDYLDAVKALLIDDILVAEFHISRERSGLSGFPHHIHEGDGTILPGRPVSIFIVLDEIAKCLK